MAPVVGYNNEEERVRSAVATAEKDVQGMEEWKSRMPCNVKYIISSHFLSAYKVLYSMRLSSRMMKSIHVSSQPSIIYQMTNQD